MKTRNTTRNYLTAICVAIAALGTAGMAQAQAIELSNTASAQQTNKKFNVVMTIVGACTAMTTNSDGNANNIEGADIDFGEVASDAGDKTASSKGATTSSIQVACTKDMPFGIGLKPSVTNGGTDNGTGKMAKGGDKIPYTLYQPTISSNTATAATSKVWGNVVNTNTLNLKGKGLSNNWTLPVSAKVLGNDYKDMPVGKYVDTVTATLYY